MGMRRPRPSAEILSGDSADVYFARAESILRQEGLDPIVSMEVFTRQEAVLCGIDEAKNLLGHVLASADPAETQLEALDDGDLVAPKEIVLRIRARYRHFGLYETAFLGMLAQSTGWATAARECVETAAPDPVISFGRAVVAIREDEIAANAMGVRTREAKILAFAASSFFGGVAGALFAHQIQFINPSSFDIIKSTEILVMVYLGGIGSLAGSILGAVIFTFLSQALQPLGTWRMVIMPLILVFLMLFRPRGILGLRELIWFLPERELSRGRQT